jgi:hypothetical protein
VAIEIREAAKSNWVRLASFETDATGSGSPRMRLPEWPDGS